MARRWGLVFVAFAVLLYLAAPLISSNFAYLLSALYLLAALLLWPAPRPGTDAEVLFPARLTAGRPATVTVRLAGRMKLPRFVLVAELLLPEALRAALDPQAWQVRFLARGTPRGLAGTLTPPRRGVYACDGLLLTAYGFAGLAAPPQRLGGRHELIGGTDHAQGLGMPCLRCGSLARRETVRTRCRNAGRDAHHDNNGRTSADRTSPARLEAVEAR